jgi:hypothetical protein
MKTKPLPFGQGVVFRLLETHVPIAKTISDPSDVPLKDRLGLISESEFAALRRVKISALWNERSLGKGPTFLRVGRAIYYPIKEIEKYLAGCTVKPARAMSTIVGVPSRHGKSSVRA